MNPAEWEKVEAIFSEARHKPVEERQAFVESACTGEPALLMEVHRLLRAAESDPGFLEDPFLRIEGGAIAPETEELPASIGGYRLEGRLGRGGMGDVFLAVHEAEDFEQRVALKVIRRGMDTDDVLRRFRLERQILASLSHPNIAHLLDAGATLDGLPYFVMDYVQGVPQRRGRAHIGGVRHLPTANRRLCFGRSSAA